MDLQIVSGMNGFEAERQVEALVDPDAVEEYIEELEEDLGIESRAETFQIEQKDEEVHPQNVTPWDELTPKELTEELSVSIESGLSSTEAASRLARDGPNELHKPKRPGLAALFLLQLLNLIIILLIFAAIASIGVNASTDSRDDPVSYVEGIAIFVIVFLNAGIGAFTENQAAGALEALAKLSQATARVIRDGEEKTVPSVSLVQGDIVLLGTGDIVPADVRLINADDLKVNEMLLTGEPDDVSKFSRMKSKKRTGGEKLTPENMAFSSCTVTNGKALVIIVETGMKTKVGRIATLLSAQDQGEERSKKKKKRKSCLPDTKSGQTPLQKSLQSLGVRIGIFAIIVCLILFFIGLGLNVVNLNEPEQPTWLYMILIAVTLAVAAIPEGIPLCVTISLSSGCNDMVKKNVLVRRLAAVETLGCASVICTDKTGTLTEGKMRMVNIWSAGVDYDVSGSGFNPTTGEITYSEDGSSASTSPGVVNTLGSALLCCNTTVVEESPGTWVPRGNSTEAPIVVAAGKIGMWTDNFESEMSRVFEVPFSSSRKMMLTVTKAGGNVSRNTFKAFEGIEHDHFGHVKGAPNFIVDKCDSWLGPDGKLEPFTEEAKSECMAKVDELSSKALRVLAVACRPMKGMPFDPTDEEIEMSTDEKFEKVVYQPGLTFLGIVASIDKERAGVPDAVLDANSGHIRVVMITGDYLPTAKAIAHNVNILKPDDDDEICAMDCKFLKNGSGEYKSDDEIDDITLKIKVFARAQPEDKLEIVKSMQRHGLVSAMTGDGVNDAPALKRADIGVAMGIQGTEVAKGASEMVLTDDDFCSIVVAVEKGRVIYAGIQKFVAFILSVHLAEVLQIFICIAAQIPIMRTPLQILFLILVTDLPPSVALGMERSATNILKEYPRPKSEPILLPWMWQGVVANAVILSVTTLAVFIWALDFYIGKTGVDDILKMVKSDNEIGSTDTIEALGAARTSAFISLVWSENIRAYTSRSFTEPVWVNLCGNRTMQYAIAFAEVALFAVLFIPYVSSEIFELNGSIIGMEGWVAALLGALGTLVLCEGYKCVTAPQRKRYQIAKQKKLEAEQNAKNDNVKIDVEIDHYTQK